MLVLGAFLVFQKYITRGFAGRWKVVGESLGQGRIYDPKLTTECVFDPPSGVWYNKACVESGGSILRVRRGCLQLKKTDNRADTDNLISMN